MMIYEVRDVTDKGEMERFIVRADSEAHAVESVGLLGTSRKLEALLLLDTSTDNVHDLFTGTSYNTWELG